jgi:spoIIIJ-associated protein
MSEYQEFTGKNVEEALRKAREAFGVTGLDDLDFEILTPGSRGVLGMGAEPARILAASRAALGGAAPRREAAASVPLPAAPPREDRGFDRERGGRGFDRDRGAPRSDRDRSAPRGPRPDDRGPRPDDRGPRPDDRGPGADDRRPGDRPAQAAERGPRPDDRPPRPNRDPGPVAVEPQAAAPAAYGAGSTPFDEGLIAAAGVPAREPRQEHGDRGGDRGDRGPRQDRGERGDRTRSGDRRSSALSQREQAEVTAARASLSVEREEIQAAEASPEALEAGREILERLLVLMGFQVTVSVRAGETSKLDVSGEGEEKEALGALIGRKGERLSALQHLVNLMLSRKVGSWTRVLVDVEDYRGRRERQLQELAIRAAQRVVETGKMLQLEPMPALERRWIHLALRNDPNVATQSIGEEPERRVVVISRGASAPRRHTPDTRPSHDETHSIVVRDAPERPGPGTQAPRS